MAVLTLDFDWLLAQASVIAFEPGRPSLYIFALGMTQEDLQAQVLAPMAQAQLFNVAQTQVIDASKRDRYRGQLPRVGLSLFELAGQQFGLVLSDHPKFPADLAQYSAWLAFWHQRLLEAQRAQATS
jgi:hypothetical protein